MNEDPVRLQMRQMADAGCGGFFIHPRQGMTLPYLSKTYFARVRLAVEEAKRYDLEVWLYDEHPYPLGIAGGLVTANRPELRERTLDKTEFGAHGGETLRREFELGRVVSALACPVENGAIDWEHCVDLRGEIGVVLTREQFWYWPMGHIPTNEKRFMADKGKLVLEWSAPAGEWQVFVVIEREVRGFSNTIASSIRSRPAPPPSSCGSRTGVTRGKSASFSAKPSSAFSPTKPSRPPGRRTSKARSIWARTMCPRYGATIIRAPQRCGWSGARRRRFIRCRLRTAVRLRRRRRRFGNSAASNRAPSSARPKLSMRRSTPN